MTSVFYLPQSFLGCGRHMVDEIDLISELCKYQMTWPQEGCVLDLVGISVVVHILPYFARVDSSYC